MLNIHESFSSLFKWTCVRFFSGLSTTTPERIYDTVEILDSTVVILVEMDHTATNILGGDLNSLQNTVLI